ncbi:hypothetical protein HPB47_011802 [Ixodes persulcatus]|uniref:Uncharacterized protein n=1 Tax=Ixodes persulcatus TaxID=34615 RepID=A0AC60NV99_IXOPE|nr:hypothetical protein HPB47_011802 [Ixodes persulcatus]
MQHLLWIALLIAVSPTWAASDCDIETIREKVAATDERLRRTDNSGPRGGYSFSKQTCEELEILFNAIESRLSRCTESEKNRYGLILDSGRRMAELKCRDVMDSAASKEYISCLRNYNHTADHCMERLSALKDEYKEYSAGLTNSNDVCCAYHSYHKCLGDKLSSGCGEEARQYTELYADKLTNKLLYNFCKNYETSVCVDTDSGSQLTMSVFTLLVATFVVQTASPTW